MASHDRDAATMYVSLPASIWGQIVLAANESEDWRLRQLIEQAVHEAGTMTVTPFRRTEGGFLHG